MTTLRDRLRALPAFPADLPLLDPDQAPDSPDDLFLAWLEDAIEAGERQPHGMTLTTLNADDTAVGRILILKDLDEDGYHFSTHRSSRKGEQVAERPRASMVFWFKEAGRTVRVTGAVRELSEEASQRDWEGRPSYDGEPNPDWQLYALHAEEIEFMQAREDRNHTRLEYRREGDDWSRGLVTTPAG
ncbi:pyridoxine/pyridoxamine 5'-phosphate oxidase [Kytococcus sp. Marseille-QA3725]